MRSSISPSTKPPTTTIITRQISPTTMYSNLSQAAAALRIPTVKPKATLIKFTPQPPMTSTSGCRVALTRVPHDAQLHITEKTCGLFDRSIRPTDTPESRQLTLFFLHHDPLLSSTSSPRNFFSKNTNKNFSNSFFDHHHHHDLPVDKYGDLDMEEVNINLESFVDIFNHHQSTPTTPTTPLTSTTAANNIIVTQDDLDIATAINTADIFSQSFTNNNTPTKTFTQKLHEVIYIILFVYLYGKTREIITYFYLLNNSTNLYFVILG